MRTRPLSPFLLSAALVFAAPATGQSVTEMSAGLSVGLFDDVALGLGGSVTTGVGSVYSDDPDYGVYSNDGGSRYGDYRYGGGRSSTTRDRAYSDYCWDRSWDLRWSRSYYHGYDGWPTYDHLDFYHDCLSSGIDYAYGRWASHTRRSHRWNRPWGVHVNVYVTDPFWRPWGPYWAYDPWGWYWDGRGRRYGGVVYAGRPTRTVWVDRGFGAPRPSPLSGPRFKEDPVVGGVRTATPRGGRAAPASAPAIGERLGRPSVSAAPAAPGGRRAADVGRSARPAAPDRAAPRERPSDAARAPASGERGGRAAPAAPLRDRGGSEGAADVGRRGPAAPATPRASEPPRGDDAPSARARPESEPATVRPEPRAAPRALPRSAPREAPPSEPRAAPESAPRERPRAEPAPSSGRGGGERSAPAVRSEGGERAAPAVRSGGSPGPGGAATPRRRSGGDEPN